MQPPWAGAAPKLLDATKHYSLPLPVPAAPGKLKLPPHAKAPPARSAVPHTKVPPARSATLPALGISASSTPVVSSPPAPALAAAAAAAHSGPKVGSAAGVRGAAEITVKAPALALADETAAPAENVEVVYPMGDFRYNDRARARKLDVLMGIAAPPVQRREVQLEEPRMSERPATATESWEASRARARAVAAEAATIALKRDGEAWEDEDGYAQAREPPAHRDGYNFTLRVKPAPEAHLHNGLSALPMSTARPESRVVAALRADDAVHRCVSQRSDVAAMVGALFMRGIHSGIVGTAEREAVQDGSRVHGEIELLLRMLEELEAPPDGYTLERMAAEAARRAESETAGRALGANTYVSGVDGMALPAASREATRRADMVTLARALGNAFVSIGMTLPAGTREDPLRSDSVALAMGNRVMAAETGAAHGVRIAAPAVPESLRREVAIAVGRALLHLRAAAANMYGARLSAPTLDAAARDRTIVNNVGRLTLQLLEASALRVGKVITKDPHRREVLADALGSTVMAMDSMLAPAALRSLVAERDRAEAPALTRAPAPLPALAAPAAAKTEIARANKARDAVNKRPLLPGRDVVPVELMAKAAAAPVLVTRSRRT